MTAQMPALLAAPIAVVAFVLGVKYGQAKARALRAWRDLVGTKNTIKGLWARVRAEWGTAVKVGALVGLVVFGGLWLLVATR